MSPPGDLFGPRRIEHGPTTGQLDHPVGDSNETMMDEDRRQVGAAFGLAPVLSATITPEEQHSR
jgi:hypothetical protein